MNSLMTEIWKCVKVADSRNEEIKVRMHPNTIEKMCEKYDEIFVTPIDRSQAKIFGKPVVADEDIIEDSFWIEVVK